MARVKKTLLALIAAGIIIPAISGLVFLPRAKTAWSVLEADCAKVEQEHLVASPAGAIVRSSIRTEQRPPASAWDAYMQALRVAGRQGLCNWSGSASLASLLEESEAEREARQALLARSESVLKEFRRGTMATERTYEPDWTAESWDYPWGVTPLSVRVGRNDLFFASIDLPNLAYMHFLDGFAAEDPNAVEYLLDGLQLASDMAALPLIHESAEGAESLVPKSWLAFGFQGGWSQLPAESLAYVIDAIDRADSALATVGDTQAVHLALEARCMGNEVFGPMDTGGRALRFIFSPLLERRVQAVAQSYGCLFELAAAHRATLEAGGGLEPMALIDQFADRLESGILLEDWPRIDREIVDSGLDAIRFHTKKRLRGLARLRLLRRALYDLAGKADRPTTTRLGRAIGVETQDSETRYVIEHDFYQGVEVRLPAS